jgi:hypothetical protein
VIIPAERFSLLRYHITAFTSTVSIKKINYNGGHTPSEMFLIKGRLNNSSSNKKIKQIKESVTHVGK